MNVFIRTVNGVASEFMLKGSFKEAVEVLRKCEKMLTRHGLSGGSVRLMSDSADGKASSLYAPLKFLTFNNLGHCFNRYVDQ
jgi:hypothetical protein